MSGSVSLATAQEMLNLYIEAEKAILKNQSYTIKDRTFTRANLSIVARERARWRREVDRLSGRGIRARRAVPRDL
jgi:hypothetical protein